MKDYCIVNAYIGGAKWYAQGQQRLVNSLKSVGFEGDVLTFSDEVINGYFMPDCLYTIKAAALAEARNMGYKKILWLDCSVWPIKNPQIIFDIIEKEGAYFWASGFNCAQTCNDNILHHFMISRDIAETLPECASSMFGFDLNTEKGKLFLNLFLRSAAQRTWHGSREHDNQSADPRFLFHRQDQSAASLAFHAVGFERMYLPGKYSQYQIDGEKIGEEVVLLMRGM